jgi:hypothetical protein
MYIGIVRSTFKTVCAAFVIIISCKDLRCEISQATVNQCEMIQERNAFGLRPAPVQVATAEAPAPLPKITLTGITTILENKRALLKVAPAGLKPGETNKEISLILTEGQRDAEIEVLQIDEKSGSVKVNNSGTIMVLTFEKDGVKLPVAQPTLPGLPPTPHPPPTAGLPGPNPSNYPARGLRGLRNRDSYPNASLLGGPASNIGATVPVASVPTPPVATSFPDQNLTPEEQAVLTELQRQVNATNPALPASPPNSQPTGGAPSPAGNNSPAIYNSSSLPQ